MMPRQTNWTPPKKKTAIAILVQPLTKPGAKNLAKRAYRIPRIAKPEAVKPSQVATLSGTTEKETIPSMAKRSILKRGNLVTPASRAERYLESVLKYPANTFDAVLAWDLLDYLDAEVVPRLVARLTSVVRDGGVLLAMFHARKPEAFHRYRVLDAQNLELIPSSCPFAPQRVFQNREISNLFRRFHSSKTFVGRDQIREGLFIK